MWSRNEEWESRDKKSMARLGRVTEMSVELESNIFCHSSTLKLEVADCSESLVPLYKTTWRYINLHTHSIKSVKNSVS